MRMLWAFEPVKYCSAAPQTAGHNPQVDLDPLVVSTETWCARGPDAIHDGKAQSGP